MYIIVLGTTKKMEEIIFCRCTIWNKNEFIYFVIQIKCRVKICLLEVDIFKHFSKIFLEY